MNGSRFRLEAAPETAPPRSPARICIIPVAIALLGILISSAAAISGQDARRNRDLMKLNLDRYYWENELAQAKLAHEPPEKIANIEATLDQVRDHKLISYARYGRQFTQWDGYHYEEIVDQGYIYHLPDDPPEIKEASVITRPGWPEKRSKNVVWYPLYPLIGIATMKLTGLPSHWALTTVSWTCALLASFLVFLFASRHYYHRREELRLDSAPDGDLPAQRTAASWAVAALFLGPCSIFFYANFTESLFILLLAAFLCCIQARWWWRAALVAALASSCRSQGVLFGPILALSYMLRTRKPRFPINLLTACLLGFISSLGLISYMIFLQFQFHDPLAFMYAQKYWNVGLGIDQILHALNPIHAMTQILRYSPFNGEVDWPRLWEALCLLWPPILLLLARRRLSFELALTGWIFWGLPYVSNSMAGYPPLDSQWMSMGRFMSVLLPLPIVVGGIAIRKPWFGILYSTASAAAFGIFAYKYGAGDWVG